MKCCTKCHEDKALAAFPKQKSSNDGLSPWCRSCRRNQTQNRYWKHGGRELNATYCQLNKDKIRTSRAKTAHKPNSRYKWTVKYAGYRGLEFNIALEDYIALIALPCSYCGFSVEGTGCGLDRIDNSRGYTTDNVIQCCKICNQARSDFFSVEEMKVIGTTIRQVILARSNVMMVGSQREY